MNYGFKDDEMRLNCTQTFPEFSENGPYQSIIPFGISQFEELTQAVLKHVLDMFEQGIPYNEIQDMIVECFRISETSELEDFLAKVFY
jgi:hypothetical protein